MKVLCRGAIVLRRNHRRVDGFWKVLVEHLLPVGLVPAQEYILELLEGLSVVQIDLLRTADEFLIVLSRVNSMPNWPESLWISAICLLRGELLCNL